MKRVVPTAHNQIINRLCLCPPTGSPYGTLEILSILFETSRDCNTSLNTIRNLSYNKKSHTHGTGAPKVPPVCRNPIRVYLIMPLSGYPNCGRLPSITELMGNVYEVSLRAP